jgi:hypothetical protein
MGRCAGPMRCGGAAPARFRVHPLVIAKLWLGSGSPRHRLWLARLNFRRPTPTGVLGAPRLHRGDGSCWARQPLLLCG